MASPTTEDNARILVRRGGMRMSPFFIPMILPNMAAANVSRIYGLKGYTSTVITACAAGTQGIGEAAVAIQRGVADVALGGGCEAGISQLGLGGFNVIRALSRQNEEPEKASRPFDLKRDGFVPGEGAAILVMESLEHAIDRGAEHPGRSRRLRRVLRRLPLRAARRGRLRRGQGDTLGAGGRGP